jgi:hypothetical protein
MEVVAQALFALIGVALLTQVADGTEMLSWATYEWEPLEEVIVGRLDGAVVPPNHVSVTYKKAALDQLVTPVGRCAPLSSVDGPPRSEPLCRRVSVRHIGH